MPQKDVDDLYEQIKATGRPGGVFIQGSVTQTLRGTARVLPVSATAMELVNPTGGTENLPMTGKDARKLRSPKDFVDAARRYLEPDDVGKMFATAITDAFKASDHQMLKLLIPYLYGPAPTDPSMGASSDAMEALLHILTESKPAPQPRPRHSRVVDGILMDITDHPELDTTIIEPLEDQEEMYDGEED
jgi:hypothetical protein